ncbi:MAG: lytic transglycosylase domain-containing protein [Mediterranea sp.]|jgi:hypothetical protein|nr:lytic transglycosylase domain-containing protein [Mediterranea sp.]
MIIRKLKRYLPARFIVLFVAALGCGASLTLLTGNSPVDAQHSPKSEVPYCVSSPTVPTEVRFDGITIDLRRYDRRERMDRELMAFTYMHSTTMLLVKRANRYFPLVEPLLKANGIPDDFKYLMVIESNLNPIAHSPAGAAGLWQFMPATGREYGLEVNDNVDERYHIEKATVAACAYFRKAYARYGDWMAVAAAYNAGQARISSQLDKQLASHAMDLWLNEETSRYMFRLLAVKEVMSNPPRYGFLLKRADLYPAIPYTEIQVSTPIDSLDEFARQRGISYAQLRDANPWLREHSLKNRSSKLYVLHIPTREGMYYDPRKTVAYDKRWVID